MLSISKKKVMLAVFTLFSVVSMSLSTDYTMDLTIGNATIPVESTVYMCKMFDVSELLPKVEDNFLNSNQTRFQAYEYEPIIQTDIIHHIVLYGCDEDIEMRFDNFRCEEIMLPKCRTIVGGNIHGSPNLYFPNNTGLDWGVGITKKVVLQIHYNNPMAEFQDDSGLRVKITDEIRPYSIGIMLTGVNETSILLPPGSKNITISDTCPVECTNQMPAEGIKVILGILHGHKLMKRIRLEIHHADGTLDDTTFRDDRYDFNTQYFKVLDTPIEIKPGDFVKTVCEYDTSLLNTPVTGGPSTMQEMCFGFLGYYPKQNGLFECGTSLGCISPS